MENRQIDTLVAQYVMGFEISKNQIVTRTKLHNGTSTHWEDIPHYTTNIAAAWQVVEKLREQGYSVDCGSWKNTDDGNTWYAEFEKEDELLTARFRAASTISLAICLAALKAVGIDTTSSIPKL